MMDTYLFERDLIFLPLTEWQFVTVRLLTMT